MGRSIREGLSREEKCYTEVAGILLDCRKEEIKVEMAHLDFLLQLGT